MVFLSDEARDKNTFEGNKLMFLDTLDKKVWLEFLSKFNQKVDRKIEVDEFKEELWDTVVEFGEPVLMATGLDEKAREDLLSKMYHMHETRANNEPKYCKGSFTLKKKSENKKVKNKIEDKDKPIIIAKDNRIPKTRGGKRQESDEEGLDKEASSLMVVTTPPSRGVRSMKRKWEKEKESPSADAVSGKNGAVGPIEMEDDNGNLQEQLDDPEDGRGIDRDGSRNQIKCRRRLQTSEAESKKRLHKREVDLGKEWISSERQSVGKPVTIDPLEKGLTRNTARAWWIALDTTKELEGYLKKLDCGVSRKRRNWATQH